MILPSLLLSLCAPIGGLPAEAQQDAIDQLRQAVEAPMALYVTGEGVPRPLAIAAGAADPATGRPMSVDTPVRIASNTKTFVAAAVLRLYEQELIELDAAIPGLVDPKLIAILRSDGYDPDRITVRHLLSHSAGLYDQGGDRRFITTVLAAPDHRWTRHELVQLMAEYDDPQGEPGEMFLYSDIGYVLLGDIVERRTGRPLAAAVRELLRFDALGLQSTWWETAENAPAGVAPRARQYFQGQDATDVHPSFDLFGGGGLVMSARDLATWFAALFEGQIFDRPETLRTMTKAGTHVGAERYRLGLFAQAVDGREVYSHSGFWGTLVYYDPRRRRAVAALTTRTERFRSELVPLAESVLGLVPQACRDGAAIQQDGGVTAHR
ncbi:serine hydrolase [Sphingosinicella sp. CPCC 101087]|uniref:serine hydrolase domain-containing protein n=1 Tax=Sphingosinicella sp. CPCC 101087 TaxID=2497754 RepID=UPI00198081DE|nr:serine hydrolase domain-containing protein [Sphingosinicella sp. CPCC 101087]